MGFRKQRLSISEAKAIDMVDYLSELGYQPAKIRNVDYWYSSPLRNEKVASFKINRKLNCWYDYGLGKGGNLIDFGIELHGCSVGEFLQKLYGDFLFTSRFFIRRKPQKRKVKLPFYRVLNLPQFPCYDTSNNDGFLLK